MPQIPCIRQSLSVSRCSSIGQGYVFTEDWVKAAYKHAAQDDVFSVSDSAQLIAKRVHVGTYDTDLVRRSDSLGLLDVSDELRLGDRISERGTVDHTTTRKRRIFQPQIHVKSPGTWSPSQCCKIKQQPFASNQLGVFAEDTRSRETK